MQRIRWLVGLVLLSALSGIAHAVPVTYYFNGSFTLADGSLSALAGQGFQGQFAYDSDFALIFTGGNFLQYRMPAGALTAESTDGSGSTSLRGAPDNLMDVVWGATIGSATLGGNGNYIFAHGATDSTGSWSTIGAASLIFLDTSRTALGSTRSPIPAALPDLASWTDTEFQVFDEIGSRAAGALGCLSTDATACAPSRVPEPATLVLLSLAMAALAVVRRWSRCAG